MNIFVGNLNPETIGESLIPLFSEFGQVVSAKVIRDPATGMSRGFGFVEMAEKHEGFDAINNLDCSYFQGNIISVKEAKQNKDSDRSRSNDRTRSNDRARSNSRGYNNNFNRRNAEGGYNRDNSSDRY